MKTKDDLEHIGIAEIYAEIRSVKGELQDIKYMEKQRKDYIKLLEKSLRARVRNAERRLVKKINNT